MMFSLEVEVVVMQVVVKMMVHDVLYMISMQMMFLLHVIQHVVTMVVQFHAVPLVVVRTEMHHLRVIDA